MGNNKAVITEEETHGLVMSEWLTNHAVNWHGGRNFNDIMAGRLVRYGQDRFNAGLEFEMLC